MRELRGTELVMKQPSKGRVVRALDSAEASFVAERELLGMRDSLFKFIMRDKSIPRTIFVACGQPEDLRKRLVSCFTCCKTRNEHCFVIVL